MKMFKVLLIISLFTILFVEFFHPITALNQDFGRHLLTGEIIVHTHHVPNTNLFSYTYPNFPFINTHWLSEVIYYALVSVIGLHGLLIISTAIMLCAFALVLFYSLKQSNIFSIAITSLLFFNILAERTDIRPEIFSILWTALFTVILYMYRTKYTRLIFLLPVIELLWVNMHIYFIAGIILMGLFLIDMLYYHRVEIFIKKNISKQLCIYFCIFTLTCFITLCNPHGITGALYPFLVFNNYGYTIQENQNVFFLLQFGTSTTIIFLFFSTVIFFTCMLISMRKTRLIDWLLAIVFTILAFQQIRNVVLFVFVLFIPFSYALHTTSDIFLKNISKEKRTYVKNILFSVLIICVLWEMIFFMQQRGFGWDIREDARPAINFFIQNNLEGPIFNNFDIGSDLEYRLYPKINVFVDGRPEAYPASFFQQIYIPMQEDPKIFLQQDTKYHFNTIIFSLTDQTPWASQFISQITNNASWHIVYLDSYNVILVKNNKINEALMQKFGMDKDHIKINNLSNEAMQLYRLDNFFVEAGWIQQVEKIDQKILANEPDNCIALAQLARIYNQSENNMYATRYILHCQQ